MGHWRYLWLVAAFAIPLACDLNPQPEVPSGSSGGKGGAKGGSGGISLGGSGAVSGAGGTSSGGVSAGGAGGGAGGSSDAGTNPCGNACVAGQLCHDAICVDDPCTPNDCPTDQVCKPNPTFTDKTCSPSCASVTCGKGERCVDGVCEATGCGKDCAPGSVCRSSGDAGLACEPDPCSFDGGVTCPLGDVCDPVSGECIENPCLGVQCPAGQACSSGECAWLNDAGSPVGDAGND